MYVTQYLSKDVKPGKINFSLRHLIEMTQEMKLTHLPIFDGLDYIGNIAEEDLLDLSTEDDIKSSIIDLSESFYLYEEETLFDAIQKMSVNQTNILPVLTKEGKYVGCITQIEVIDAIAKFPFSSEVATSMIVSIATADFSMSVISNIIESNNGKMLGSMIINQEEDQTQVLVRFSSSNLLSIGETFERFGYQVVQKFYNDEKQELINSRYAQLLKYMNT